MDHDEALSIFEKGGCWVNKKTKVVRFPSHLVNEAMAQCPSHILLAGREPEKRVPQAGRIVAVCEGTSRQERVDGYPSPPAAFLKTAFPRQGARKQSREPA